jgi:VanZ family protein
MSVPATQLTDPHAPAPLAKGAWPARWHYALAGCFFLALAVYGSLVPLEYRSLPWHTAVGQFIKLFAEGTARFSRTDIAVNVLLFVPVAFCFLAAATAVQNRLPALLMRGLMVFVCCTIASVLIEFSQMWFIKRTASAYDVYAQMVGTLVGLAGWILVGRAFSDWLRTRSAAHARLVSLSGMLAAYYAGLVLYWMLPLDLTVRPAELARKFRAGNIGLRPLAEVQSLAAAIEACSHIAAFVPVGMLAVVLFTSYTRPVRSWLGSLVFGGALVSLVWTAGLLAVSHYSSSTQWLAGLLGAGIGIALARWWLVGLETTVEAASSAPRRDRFWLYVILALMYVGILVVLFCYPEGASMKPVTDTRLLHERFQSMFRPPLASLYKGSIFNAAKELVRKVGLFFPLGMLLIGAIQALRMPKALSLGLAVGSFLLCLLLGLGIELFQVAMPGHTPDLTDAFLCAAGGAAGILCGRYWKAHSNSTER